MLRATRWDLEHAVKKEGWYPFLIDSDGKWSVRQDWSNVAVMGSGGPGKTQVRKNEWLPSAASDWRRTGIGHQIEIP